MPIFVSRETYSDKSYLPYAHLTNGHKKHSRNQKVNLDFRSKWPFSSQNDGFHS